MKIDELKWEVRKRLEEIERCLYWKGSVGRPDLINTFGISRQQASTDLALYQKLAPINAVFNGSLKRYEPSNDFEAVVIKPDITDYFKWAGSSDTVVASTPSPLRTVDSLILRVVINTIHAGQSIQIEYQSMSTAKSTKRRLTPHTLVFDGYRYHVRGYCHQREDFRDFVLGRIISASDPGEVGLEKGDDDAWNTKIILRLRPHPGLTDEQKFMIEKDYGMEKGRVAYASARPYWSTRWFNCVWIDFQK